MCVQLNLKPLKNISGELTTDSLRTHYDKIEPLPAKESKPSKPSKPTFYNFLKKIENTSNTPPVIPHEKNIVENTISSEKTGFTGFTGCESVDIQGVEEIAKNESGFTLGLPDDKVGLPQQNSTIAPTVATTVITDTTNSIKTSLGEFQIGDRIQINPRCVPSYHLKSDCIAVVTMVSYDDGDIWDMVHFEWQKWSKTEMKNTTESGDFGRAAMLSGWVKKLS